MTPLRPYSHAHVDDPRKVGRRIKTLREGRGMSQRELAFPGCTAVYVCRIESGDRVPSLQVLVGIAERLGTSTEYLAKGEVPAVCVRLAAEDLAAVLRLRTAELSGATVDLDDLDADELELLRYALERGAMEGVAAFAADLPAIRSGFGLGGA